MKRTPSKKAITSVPKLVNRAEKREKSAKFIADCEQSLIRILDQEAQRPGVTWAELYEVFDNKVKQLLTNKLYKDRKGHIIVASNNVRKALFRVIEESKTKEVKKCQ